jgi:hypothetical protein
MAGFDLALTRVQQHADELLISDQINQLARQRDHTFRNTILTPGSTLCWFVQQVAHGNVACSAVRHLDFPFGFPTPLDFRRLTVVSFSTQPCYTYPPIQRAIRAINSFSEGRNMFFAFFSRRPQSPREGTTSPFESLESRRLLSASSIAVDVLQLTPDDSVKTESVIVPLAVKLVKIEGTYLGHYVGKHLGKNTLQFDITHFTHTGHFKGSVIVGSKSGATAASITSGVIHSNRHMDIDFSNNAYHGTFVAIASHTGGSFNGTFTVSGVVSDTGTFNAAKS